MTDPNDRWIEKHGSIAGLPPAIPTGVQLTFDTTEKHHHQKWRCVVEWNEVHTDDIGNPFVGVTEHPREIKHYDIDFQKADADMVWDQKLRRHTSGAKDNDANDIAHHIFHNIRKFKHYRARVRAIGSDGSVGEFSEWTTPVTPAEDIPPSPLDVTIFSNSTNRVVVDWEAPDSSDDTDLVTNDVAYFQVALMKGTTNPPMPGTWYKADRYAHVTKHSFRVKDADTGDTFYAWVRSVDGDGDRSAWIPATLAGNNNPNATPSGVPIGEAVGGGGGPGITPDVPTGIVLTFDSTERDHHVKWRCKVRWDEVTTPGGVIVDHYAVKFQKSNNGSTWTEDPRHVVIEANDDDDGAHSFAIFHNIRKHKHYRAKVRAVSSDGLKGVYSGWTE